MRKQTTALCPSHDVKNIIGCLSIGLSSDRPEGGTQTDNVKDEHPVEKRKWATTQQFRHLQEHGY